VRIQGGGIFNRRKGEFSTGVDTLSAWIEKTYGIQLRVRQCQRLFRQLEFRLRKPQPVLAKADPERQKRHKKNLENS